MNKESQKIVTRQNEPAFINVQKTASLCYKKGKYLAGILCAISVMIPITINIVVGFVANDIVSGFMILITILCFIFAEIVRQLLKKEKFYGANMQEYFDEYVFALKPNCKKYIAPRKLTLTKRIALLKKYEKKDGSKFINWYSDYSLLPYDQAVFYCQKENITWDVSIRVKYKCFLLVSLCIIAISFVVNAILQRMNIIALVSIILSFLPLVSYVYNGVTKINSDIEKQKGLMQHIESMESAIEQNKEIKDAIEELQVEIYNYRQKAYLIPDWFHNLFRKKLQAIANACAKEICNQKDIKYESDDKK